MSPLVYDNFFVLVFMTLTGCFFFFFSASVCFWLCPWHIEAPGPGIKPALHQRPKPLQWQCWILNLLCHQGTPGHVFYSPSISLGWFDVFLMIRLGHEFRKEYHGVRCPSLYYYIREYMISTWLIAGKVIIGQLVKIVFLKHLHYRVTIFPFPNSILWQQILSPGYCLWRGCTTYII